MNQCGYGGDSGGAFLKQHGLSWLRFFDCEGAAASVSPAVILGGVVLLGAAAFTAKSDSGEVEDLASSNGSAPAHTNSGDDAEPEVSDEKKIFKDCNEKNSTGMKTGNTFQPLWGWLRWT